MNEQNENKLPGRVLHTPESDRNDQITLNERLKRKMLEAINNKSIPPEQRGAILRNFRKIFGNK